MAGLTIREFTISTKVVNTDQPEKPKNQSKSENENASQNGSDNSLRQTRASHMSTLEKESIVRLCIDKVLEIMQHQQER